MKYNKENYEAYALDYLENNLTEEERAEFEVFLLLNPDIQESISQLEWVEVPALMGVVHPNKKALLRDNGNGRVIFFNRKIMSIAAAILLLLAAGVFLIQRPSEVTITATEFGETQEVFSIEEDHKVMVEEAIELPAPAVVREEAISTPRIEPTKVKNVPPPNEKSGEALATNDEDKIRTTESIVVQKDATTVPKEELLKVDERIVYSIAIIEHKIYAFIPPKKYKLEELDFPILVIDEEELLGKEPSKFKQFLARANLIPSDFTTEDYDSFKQNLLPESIPGLK